MMKRAYWLALIVALVLPACTEDESDPDELLAWSFPTQVAGFDRVSLEGGVEAGELIAGYNLFDPRSPMIATVYVYPAPSFSSVGSSDEVKDSVRSVVFRDHFARTQEAVVQNDPSARLISSGETSLRQRDSEQLGLIAEYAVVETFDGLPVDMSSFLYLFRDGDWLVKYRITYPTLLASKGDRLAASFMESLTWPAAGE